MNTLKTALLITGAAARISQEVALIDLLREKHGLKISQKETYIAGFSSGSLNIAAINACFRDTNPMSWDNYFKGDVLHFLKNSNVYSKCPLKLPWDTTPFRNTANQFLEKTNMKTVADLAFNSDIITCYKKNKDKQTFWVNSKNETHKNISISDLLMASCAIPFIFPKQEIKAIPVTTSTGLPKLEYCDGGTNGTFNNFEPVLNAFVKTNGVFENLFIVSPMREFKQIKVDDDLNAKFEENNNIKSSIKKLSSKILNELFGHFSMKGFMTFLNALKDANAAKLIAKNIFVSMPNIKQNINILNFDNQTQEYNDVKDWATDNSKDVCLSLNDFIEKYKNFK